MGSTCKNTKMSTSNIQFAKENMFLLPITGITTSGTLVLSPRLHRSTSLPVWMLRPAVQNH